MRTLGIICLMVFMGSCSSHAVRCDGRLEPINAPAKVQSAPAADSGKGVVRRP